MALCHSLVVFDWAHIQTLTFIKKLKKTDTHGLDKYKETVL